MERYPIKIDLATFLNENDLRRKALILVNSEWENVSCLQKRVRKVFNIGEDIQFLTKEGYYIAPDEPIEILKFTGELSVVLINEVNYSNESKNSSSVKNNEMKTSDKDTSLLVDKKKLKRQRRKLKKIQCLGDESSGPILSKHKKNSIEITANEEVKMNETKLYDNNILRSLENNQIDFEAVVEQHSTPNKTQNTVPNEHIEENLHDDRKDGSKRKSEKNNSYKCQLYDDSESRDCIVSKSKKRCTEANMLEQCVPNEPELENISINQNSISKEKVEENPNVGKKRNRKKKTKKNNLQEIEKNTNDCIAPLVMSAVSDQTFGTKNHIYFNQDDDHGSVNELNEDCREKSIAEDNNNNNSIQFNSTTNSIENSFIENNNDNNELVRVCFRCDLIENIKPRVFQMPTKNQSRNLLVQITENIMLTPKQNDVSDVSFSNHVETESTRISNTDSQSKIERDENLENNPEVSKSMYISRIPNSDSQSNIEKGEHLENDPEVSGSTSLTRISNSDLQSQVERDEQLENDLEVSKRSETEDDITIPRRILDSPSENIRANHIDITERRGSEDSSFVITDDDEVIDLDGSEFEEQKDEYLQYDKTRKIAKILPFCIDLNGLPRVNDIVIFKGRVKGNTLKYTNYIAGVCKYVNTRTKNIQFLIIDGQDEVHKIEGIYSGDEMETISSITLNLNKLFQAKIFTEK